MLSEDYVIYAQTLDICSVGLDYKTVSKRRSYIRPMQHIWANAGRNLAGNALRVVIQKTSILARKGA